mgnify:CR=1 FL=1
MRDGGIDEKRARHTVAKMMSNLAVSAFCESMAMMYRAGIPTEEALRILSEDSRASAFHESTCIAHDGVLAGMTFSDSLQQPGCCFPSYMVHMVDTAETAGRLEDTLFSLAHYYEDRERLATKLRNAVTYPTILLVLLAIVMLVLVVIVLPVFSSVYQNLAGSISGSAFLYVQTAYVISYVALAITLVVAVVFLVGFVVGGTQNGARKIERIFEKFPYTRRAYYLSAIANFTSALATFLASGIDPDTAVARLSEEVSHERLKAQKVDLCEPLYARMLVSGAKSGNLDSTLSYLARLTTEDATMRMDRIINRIEPLFAGFLTIALGLVLISIMLPLVGILGAL